MVNGQYKELIDRLHREGEFDLKFKKNSSPFDGDFVVAFVGVLLRESPFLIIGLFVLSFLKNQTNINFWIVLLVSVSVGVMARSLMSSFVRRASNEGNKLYRILIFIILGSVPFAISYLLLDNIFNVVSLSGVGLTIAVSFGFSVLVESSIYESLR